MLKSKIKYLLENLHLFLPFSSTSMLKWWCLFQAAILPSWGAPRSTRAAPAGPTPSRGSSVLSALQLCHTLITQETYHTQLSGKGKRGGVIGANARTCLALPENALLHTRVNKHDQTPSGDSPRTDTRPRPTAPHCRRTIAPASRNRLIPKHRPVSRVRRPMHRLHTHYPAQINHTRLEITVWYFTDR